MFHGGSAVAYQTGDAMRRLIVCCDGTWNSRDQADGGVPAPTNVVRIANALTSDQTQRVYYHPGVGVGGSKLDKMLGGGTGTGLSRNILSAYEWLCRGYQEGDQLYLFGFSRGAYTVRSLVGFINHCGLLRVDDNPPADTWQVIERLYQEGYRKRGTMAALREQIGQQCFHNAPGRAIPVRFLGVWDTVGALGIPDDLAWLDLLDDPADHTFHSTSLSANVRTARHALAMDEQRKAFAPTLWSDIPVGADVKQLWFPGVHADVGGGYRECGLSDGALAWMIEEAKQAGLTFNDSICRQIRPNHHDTLHDPRTGIFAMLETQPRSIPSLLDEHFFHDSARDRLRDPPIHQCPYRQPHLTPDGRAIEIYAREPWNPTGLWLEAGKRYRFEARGQWVDGTLVCGPAGTEDGNFELGELAHIGANLWGRFEAVFREATRNPHAQFRGTRRHDDIAWFCLTGAIANGRGECAGNPEPHEAFRIGTECTHVPQRSGYLYAYANDAFGFYGNNRGFVTLTVRQID